MYVPTVNREDNPDELKRFMREHPFCALVSIGMRGITATHIPVVLHEMDGTFGILRGHVARGNSQWRDFDAAVEALAIFTGPQHYISASWYPGKKTHGEEVPTWNYIAVHVYGTLRAVEDPAWLLEHLTSLTDQSEATAKEPWKVSDAPRNYIDKMSRAIVGLEMQISRVEGRWKASQNRTDEEANAVMENLARLGTSESATMRQLVQDRRPKKKPTASSTEESR